ncbi:hypothetical protein [uncultured Jatrophihabitans sp.]|uniref:hypothetical protein n=1 Tax=uncultured Jatrophihabitans sp. TaxID=1610747 RepID=UPI0035CC2E0A
MILTVIEVIFAVYILAVVVSVIVGPIVLGVRTVRAKRQGRDVDYWTVDALDGQKDRATV